MNKRSIQNSILWSYWGEVWCKKIFRSQCFVKKKEKKINKEDDRKDKERELTWKKIIRECLMKIKKAICTTTMQTDSMSLEIISAFITRIAKS